MRFLLPLLAAGVLLGSLQACYGATEIDLRIDTDVPCATVRTSGITIAAGSSLTESNDCTDGVAGERNTIGNLVLVPESGTPDVTIRVVLGVGRITRDCAAASNAGCIVADRRLSYRKHESLKVPIRLDNACSARQCPEGQTCSEGACVSPILDCTANGTCTPPPIDPDGGATDGGLTVVPPVADGGPPGDAGACPCSCTTGERCCRVLQREVCVKKDACPRENVLCESK